MYLISAYFDNRANIRLQKLINRIAERSGNNFMISNCIPPHLTISQIEARSVDVLEPYFMKLRGSLKRGSVDVVSPGILLPYVIYLTPVINEYLTGLSKTVYEVFADIPETGISKYYKPMSWLPHITVAKTLSKEQMMVSLDEIYEKFAPFDAEIVEIGLAKTNPHEDIAKIIL